jgi:hypothetical protein
MIAPFDREQAEGRKDKTALIIIILPDIFSYFLVGNQMAR